MSKRSEMVQSIAGPYRPAPRHMQLPMRIGWKVQDSVIGFDRGFDFGSDLS